MVLVLSLLMELLPLWLTKLMESMESDSQLEELQDELLPMKLLLRPGHNWWNLNFDFQLCSLEKLRYQIFEMDMLPLHIHKLVKLISMIASISRNFDNQFFGRFLPFGPAVRRRSCRTPAM